MSDKHKSRSLRRVTLRGAIDTASIRTSSFRDEDHIVVPVVAMVGDIVVQALNADSRKSPTLRF